MTDNFAEGSEERITVQFFPCGHVLNQPKELVIEVLNSLDPNSPFIATFGGAGQLEDIGAGIKLDAVILPKAACSQCKANSEERNRITEDMMSL